jgi:type IV fimbrial biogenesis protein FimT
MYTWLARRRAARCSVRIESRHLVAGFSLYELIITLAIVSILGTMACGMYGMIGRQQVVSEANQVVSYLALARNEAVRRHEKITFCPAPDGRHCDNGTDAVLWNDGGMVFIDTNANGQLDADETLVRMHQPMGKRLRVKTSGFRPRVVYHPNGMSGGSTVTFTVCDTSNPLFVRYVIVSNVGRARVALTPPDGKTDQTLERCI